MSEGTTAPTGEIKLTLNPPTAEKTGVVYGGCWVRAELDDEGNFTVRLFGQAAYAGRSVSDHVDLTDTGLTPIKDALAQVLSAYGKEAENTVMQSAFAARAFAQAQGEIKEEA